MQPMTRAEGGEVVKMRFDWPEWEKGLKKRVVPSKVANRQEATGKLKARGYTLAEPDGDLVNDGME